MENISLILSDLDGTLFHNDKSISAFTKQVIAEAQQKGILFGISTARAGINAIKFLDGISPDILITNGGGMVTFHGKKIYNCEFTMEESRQLIQAVFDVFGKDTIISVDNENNLYSNSREDLSDKFWTFNDFSDFHGPCMKICIETLDEEKVKKTASVIGIDQIDFLPFSDIPWYKLSKKDATKEKAINVLCKHIKIPPEKVAAFGDDFNDIGMLEFCGKGFLQCKILPEPAVSVSSTSTKPKLSSFSVLGTKEEKMRL